MADEPMSTDFTVFAKAVHTRFAELSTGELYLTNPGDGLFDTYLAAFPEGTNPIIKKRPLYDCNTCRQFVRRLGKTIGIKGGKVLTVWEGLDLPQPFRGVAAALDAAVRAAPVVSVFRSKEGRYGQEYNYDKVTTDRYDHFWGDVVDRHRTSSPGEKIGEMAAAYQVLSRGLLELRETDLVAVLELIDANDLYKGAEFRPAVAGFLELLRGFMKADKAELYVWEHLNHPNARFKNTAIGNLVEELVGGKEIEAAVKSYEKMVAPENYKRTSAPITQGMVEAAVQKLEELGLTGAVNRRYARPSDVSVNDVLFVDNDVRGRMKDGLVALLAGSVKHTPPNLKHATPIAADDFVASVLPGSKTLEVFVENRHQGNFVSLTTSDNPSLLFKWPNVTAWSYDGNVADSMRQRVAALGGRVDGPFRFTHSWNHEEWGQNQSLMDLHVFFPGHNTPADGIHDNYGAQSLRVGWNRRDDPKTGGVQDVDHVHVAKPGEVPIENISFPSVDRMPEGVYTLKCHNWNLRGVTKSGFKAEVEAGGQLVQFEHPKPLANKQWVTVATVTLKAGQFTITPVLPTTTTSKDKWGVKTETLVPVAMVTHSPNHWGGHKVGAKHLIFALKDCENPEPTRGIYNEMLRDDLLTHRKVFEHLAAKTKCPPAKDQISGVGFTAARGDSVTVVVDGKRAYILSF